MEDTLKQHLIDKLSPGGGRCQRNLKSSSQRSKMSATEVNLQALKVREATQEQTQSLPAVQEEQRHRQGRVSWDLTDGRGSWWLCQWGAVWICATLHTVGGELAQALLGSDLYTKQSLDEYLHQDQWAIESCYGSMTKGMRTMIALRAHGCAHIWLTILGLGSPGHQIQSPVKHVFLTHSDFFNLCPHVPWCWCQFQTH